MTDDTPRRVPAVDVPASFACQRCGGCCKPRGYVRLDDGEPAKIAEFLGLRIAEFMDRYTRITLDRRGLSLEEQESGACAFLSEEGGCRIQAVKPRQCSEFPWKWNYPGFERFCAGMRACKVQEGNKAEAEKQHEQ